MPKRDYIDEIVEKKQRLLKRTERMVQFELRVHPLVKGFRYIKSLDNSTSFRSEWLKYCPIGYIASLEAYFRLLTANLIDAGSPFSNNAANFRDIKFDTETVLAVQSKKITTGEFIAHLLPLNNVEDINRNLSTILGIDFLTMIKDKPLPRPDAATIDQIFPYFIPQVQEFFRLRHLYAHELATKEKVSVRKIEQCMSSAALLIISSEELIVQNFLPTP